METHACLFCGSELRGRIDKKFCDDQCRAAYNNRHNSGNKQMRYINTVIRRNRHIIKELVPENEGKVRVSYMRLQEKGFNFIYHTHSYTTKTGNTYRFCYEYGYLPLEGGYYMLVRRQVGFDVSSVVHTS